MKTILKPIIVASLLSCMALTANSQEKKYFVDGFHGGVYGHYPLKTYTKYMSNLHDNFPQWRMCLEIEPETWDSVAVCTPEDYQRFKDIVKSPRVEYTNPSYAQPYCYNVSGESLIRQFEYGIKKLHQHFPDMTFSSYAVEEPCFTSALPMILKGFGFKYASIKCPNTCWGGYSAAHGGELVKWTGPDGTYLIASPRHAVEALGKDVWTTIANDNKDEYIDACRKAGFKHPVGMTFQDAGWTLGPWIGYGEKNKTNSTYCTWTEYFEQICTDVEAEEYIFSQEDCLGSLMWGTQVLQQIAREVRASEINITNAEKMSVIANLANGFTYNQAAIDEAWRTLLLSEHHDSWIVPYNGLQGNGTWATHIKDWTESCDRIASGVSMKAAYSSMKRDGESIIRIFNTTGNRRNETVSLNLASLAFTEDIVVKNSKGDLVDSEIAFCDGELKLLFNADVPAFGYASYRIEQDEAASKKLAYNIGKSVKVLQNDMYRIEFDTKRGGVIKSLIDLKNGGKEIIDKSSSFSFGELRGYFYDEGVSHSSCESPANIIIVEDNSYVKKVRICGLIANQPFTQTITLKAGSPVIDFDLTIDWKANVGIGAYRQKDAYNNPERAFYDERGKLNIYFPSKCEGGQLYKNAPFDVCKSKLDNTVFTNWNNIKHNIILDWVDIEKNGNGFAIFSDHTTSYSYGDTPLALTVQYSGNGLWGINHDLNGPTDLHFALMPHSQGWEELEESNLHWSEPLIANVLKADAEDKEFIRLENCGYEVSAAHMVGEDILVRFYNATGDSGEKQIEIAPCFSCATEVDLSGNALNQVQLGEKDDFKTLPVKMNRFAIKTYILKK